MTRCAPSTSSSATSRAPSASASAGRCRCGHEAPAGHDRFLRDRARRSDPDVGRDVGLSGSGTPSLAAPARPDGDGDGGSGLPVRGSDGRRRRHIQPPALVDDRLPRDGDRVDARRGILRAVGDHRALGAVGDCVHVHERRLRGVDHGRGRRRQHPQPLPARPTVRLPRRSARAGTPGRHRDLVAAGRRRRRCGDARVRARVHSPDAGDGLHAAPAQRSRLRVHGTSANRRQRRTIRMGRADHPAADRRRALHGDVERGVRPAEGGALSARHWASRRRRPRSGRLVRHLLAGRNDLRLRRAQSSDRARRAQRASGGDALPVRLHAAGARDDAGVRADRVDLGGDRSAPRRVLCPRPSGAAVHDVAERADHAVERPCDGELDQRPGECDRAGRGRAGAGGGRQRVGHFGGTCHWSRVDRAGARALCTRDRARRPRAGARGAAGSGPGLAGSIGAVVACADRCYSSGGCRTRIERRRQMFASKRRLGLPLLAAAALVVALVQTPAAGALATCSAGTPCLPQDDGFVSAIPSTEQATFTGSTTGGVLYGQNSRSASTTAFTSGVEGVYNGTSLGSGVYGHTDSPAGSAAGVFGVDNAATPGADSAGVRGVIFATGSSGAGVLGSHNGSGPGVLGSSVSGAGVYGTSNSGIGVYASSTAPNASSLFANNTSSGWGILAQTASATRPAIRGVHPGATGFGPGTEGESFSTENFASGVQGLVGFNGAGVGAAGVKGQNKSTGANGYGVWGEHLGANSGVLGTSNNEVGVWGEHEASTGSFPGVEGTTHSTSADAAGVYGVIDSNAANAAGVRGYNSNASCCGMGVAGFHAGQGIGVYGEANNGFAVSGFSPNNWSGYFQGSVNVVGTLFKSSGAFRIDNPIDPAHSYLQHSFVESPDMKNVYDGVVTTNGKGFGAVKLPAWFQALNRDFRYQLTVVGKAHWDAKAAVWDEIAHNRFTIRTDQANVKVSWQVTGIRHDPYANAHRIETVVLKLGKAEGRYVHPQLYGKPLSKSVVVLPGMTRGTKPRFKVPTPPTRKWR